MRRAEERKILASFLANNLEEQELEILEQIDEEGCLSAREDDNSNRTLLVGLQGKIERNIALALSENQITAVVGVVHTALPATPLRTEASEEMASELVADRIKNDLPCLQTVTKRADILRGYLHQGGRLISAYPEDALNKEIKGLELFQGLCEEFKDNLINHTYNGEALDSGASYIIETKNGDAIFFGIKASQANAPGNPISLFCGPINLQISSSLKKSDDVNNTQKRFEEIEGYLLERDIDLKSELSKSREYLKTELNEKSQAAAKETPTLP